MISGAGTSLVAQIVLQFGRTAKLGCRSSEDVLELARAHRVIGTEKRTWSFATTRNGKVALVSPPPRYLYRGQSFRRLPCYPVIYRHLRFPGRFLRHHSQADSAKIVADIAKTFRYFSELKKHPIAKWAKEQGLILPEGALAQHYGISTAFIDMTESIEVALFFATHRREGDQWIACERGEGQGVLYRVDRYAMDARFAPRFEPVGSQPFERPFRQRAWTCELLMGECFEQYPKMEAIVFEHDAELATEIREMAEAEGELFPRDALADVAERVNRSGVLTEHDVAAAARHLGLAYPKHLLGDMRTLLSRAGCLVLQEPPAVLARDELLELERKYATALPTWHQVVARDLEQIVVRGGGRSGRPLEWKTIDLSAVQGECDLYELGAPRWWLKRFPKPAS